MTPAHEGCIILLLRFYQAQQGLKAKYVALLLRNWLLTEDINELECYATLREKNELDEPIFREAVAKAELLLRESLEQSERLPPLLRELRFPRPTQH